MKCSNLLIRNPEDDHFTVEAKNWYKKSEATDLRIQIINYLLVLTGRSKLEESLVGRTTRHNTKKRKSHKPVSIRKYLKKRK